ncbi:uncharacterized protein V6R79_021214 [Siganus canaliculatus]
MSRGVRRAVKASQRRADMAEAVTSSDLQAKPPPKRRRILDASAIVPVPIYSNKVSSSLQLKPKLPLFSGTKAAEEEDDALWSQPASRGPPAATAAAAIATVDLSDSEEDEAEPARRKRTELARSPSPSPPASPVQQQSRQVEQKISEVNRKLRAVTSLLTPEPASSRTRRRAAPTPPHDDDDDDDDIIIVNPSNDGGGALLTPPPGARSVREIPLKIRCRVDIHKIPVLPTTPLSEVLTQLSVILNVPPPRLLLTREEAELPTDATVGELGLSITDIIECVVMAAGQESEAGDDVITVRLQSKDRDSSQEFKVHRDAPLASIFSQYVSRTSSRSQKSVRFHFDGASVAPSQTPAQLDMEDGDIIEVWM